MPTLHVIHSGWDGAAAALQSETPVPCDLGAADNPPHQNPPTTTNLNPSPPPARSSKSWLNAPAFRVRSHPESVTSQPKTCALPFQTPYTELASSPALTTRERRRTPIEIRGAWQSVTRHSGRVLQNRARYVNTLYDEEIVRIKVAELI
jgi:hypothetical protein